MPKAKNKQKQKTSKNKKKTVIKVGSKVTLIAKELELNVKHLFENMRASKNKTIEPYHHEDAAVLLGAYSGFYPMKGKVMAIALSPDEKGKYIARVHFISKMGEYEHYFYTTDLELV